jgi:serine/threonine-protein kinase
VAELLYAIQHYEEIDGEYRKKQKRKLGAFAAIVALTLVFATGGLALSAVAAQKATDTYQTLLDEAAKTPDYDTKLSLYEECIAIPNKAGAKEAYLGLIQTYKDDDSVFSVDEAQQLEKLIKNNLSSLKENPEDYTEICFETGKLFWYYYGYGDGNNNRVTNAKYAIEWFQDVLDNAPDGYENLNMARVYANIGIFYRDITTNVTEASDKGKYKPLFENLQELMDTVAADENESEIVRLELLGLSQSAIQQYATKFKIDGVTEAELTSLYSDILSVLDSTSGEWEYDSTDVRTVKKAEIVSLMDATKAAIEVAYGTSGGGD